MELIIIKEKKNIHNTEYPLRIFPDKNFKTINFSPIMIFYGGNGSGKTTLLNIISRKLNASRKNIIIISELYYYSEDVFDYLLDEPENSLSAENQLKLKQFIEDSARFYNCQFIISTHSPFILSLTDALIYDLDSNPVVSKK